MFSTCAELNCARSRATVQVHRSTGGGALSGAGTAPGSAAQEVVGGEDRVAAHVRRRAVCHQVETVCPGRAAVGGALSGATFQAVRCTLAELLTPACLNLYARGGRSMTAVAHRAPLDRGNVAWITQAGWLHMCLDLDTYRALGMQGRRVNVSGAEPAGKRGAGTERRLVSVDVACESFAPGDAVYDRVLWCTSGARMPACTWLVTCRSSKDGVVAVDLPAGVTHAVSAAAQHWACDHVPDLGAVMVDTPSDVAGATPRDGSDSTGTSMALARVRAGCTWLGGFAARLPGLVRAVSTDDAGGDAGSGGGADTAGGSHESVAAGVASADVLLEGALGTCGSDTLTSHRARGLLCAGDAMAAVSSARVSRGRASCAQAWFAASLTEGLGPVCSYTGGCARWACTVGGGAGVAAARCTAACSRCRVAYISTQGPQGCLCLCPTRMGSSWVAICCGCDAAVRRCRRHGARGAGGVSGQISNFSLQISRQILGRRSCGCHKRVSCWRRAAVHTRYHGAP